MACAASPTRSVPSSLSAAASTGEVLVGSAALGDWTTDAPGVRRKILAADLPAPNATKSVDNGPHLVARPDAAWPRVPAGFRVGLFATGLVNPRMARVAPNGDLFVVESEANRVRVIRDVDGDGKPELPLEQKDIGFLVVNDQDFAVKNVSRAYHDGSNSLIAPGRSVPANSSATSSASMNSLTLIGLVR